jgi:hypothetical protein
MPSTPRQASPVADRPEAPDLAPEDAGAGIVNLDFAGTGLLVGTSLGAAASPDTFGMIHAVLSLIAFGIGTGAFLWAYALGVSRSRTDLIGIGGLFFLAGGVAPRVVALRFRVALGVQVAAVVAAASVRPFTVVAFGILAPMLGLGLMGMWGGRYGAFGPRRD